MSVTILTKNNIDWNPNISGWELCGNIHLVCGVPVVHSVIYPEHVCPPYEATDAQTKKWAFQIKRHLLENDIYSNRQLHLLFSKITYLTSDDFLSFIEYIKNYVNWLKSCGGYEAE